MFSTPPKPDFNFSFTFILSSACALNMDKSRILLFGKELTLLSTLRKASKDIVRKGENASNPYFFPSLQNFLPSKTKFNNFISLSAYSWLKRISRMWKGRGLGWSHLTSREKKKKQIIDM